MEQKTIWMRYLITGISSLCLLVAGCGNEIIEYRMTVDFVFENQTDSMIVFDIRESSSSNVTTEVKFDLNSSSKLYTYEVEGVAKEPQPDNCCQDILIDVYAGRGIEGFSKKIRLNDTLCVIHLNEKSVLISNYIYEIVSDRHFRYTYSFTKKDFENAELCE